MLNNYVVYKHTTPSGKVYIGITCQDIRKRWKNGKGYELCTAFNRAINKYGWENITHEVLFAGLSKQEAIKKEIELISFYKSDTPEHGYNLTTGGEHYDFTDAIKSKLSQSLTNYYVEHPEARERISSSQIGRQISESTKQKMRESRLRFLSEHPERRSECGNSFRGKHRVLTNEDKRKSIMCSNGETYVSIADASRSLNVSRTSIVNHLHGRAKTAGGYTFTYA